LTHANLCAAARNIASTLELTASDRCLNVMPLFHIHGLVGAALSSLSAGASVICAPGFDATRFFGWLADLAPTWYTAVPTIHQAVLARAASQQETVAHCPLRFIRSSSAPLPPQLLMALESTFGVPVLEAYGMTEASHQMSSNPLPPRQRKEGSVGIAAGPEVAVVNEQGEVLPPNQTGEIVIRGDSVTPGYADNPEANARAFVNGWFRTGDQGHLDEDKYLFIEGRLKEIINRGGEKISPREIDEVLLAHPCVAQALTFALPHPQLGEEVAAAVVLREKGSATERELRAYAATRLAYFKVPRQIKLVDEIPKGPTGKFQRIGLAERLGLNASEQHADEAGRSFVSPRNSVEEMLARLYAQTLGLEHISVADDFFQLGGDSVLAGQLVSRVREALEIELTISSFFDTPTVAELAHSIESLLKHQEQVSPSTDPPKPSLASRRDK
jgi:acyl-CoA synthetase (AMP-forming)/AMP-acid ligase II/acyl carrier protein